MVLFQGELFSIETTWWGMKKLVVVYGRRLSIGSLCTSPLFRSHYSTVSFNSRSNGPIHSLKYILLPSRAESMFHSLALFPITYCDQHDACRVFPTTCILRLWCRYTGALRRRPTWSPPQNVSCSTANWWQCEVLKIWHRLRKETVPCSMRVE